jgi:phosphate transport system substrate-binding protein
MDGRGSRTAAAAAHECIDTLVLSRAGFLRKRVVPAACSCAVGDIVLYDSTLDLTSASYPLVDGSTSAQPLALVVAASLLGTSYGFVENTDGSRRMVAYSTAKPALADSINSIIIQHNGTHGAHVGVIEGDVDLALVARSPSPDELALADSLGVELRVEPVGLDAFVFITHERNPVDSLTLDQARGIYTGATTTWESLGGPDLPINPYQRERNSGSQELMQSLVMGDLAPIEAPDMIVFTMMGPYNALAGDTAGICYTVYFYGRHMAPADNIKFMALEGVFPEYETIASRSYCLTTEVYLLSRADLDPFTTAAHLRDWLLAPEGQGVVKESGYVPIEEL